MFGNIALMLGWTFCISRLLLYMIPASIPNKTKIVAANLGSLLLMFAIYLVLFFNDIKTDLTNFEMPLIATAIGAVCQALWYWRDMSKLPFSREAIHDHQHATQWQIAVDHFSDLTDIELRLSVLSDALPAEFRERLLDTKKFPDRHEIAKQLEDKFLTTSFGHNFELVRLGRQLLASGKKDVAQALSQTIAVLGPAGDPNIIIGRLQKQFPDEPEFLAKEESAARIAKRLLRTQYIEDAMALVQALGGGVSRTRPPGRLLAPEVLVLDIPGQTRQFKTDYEMTQWIIHKVVPTVLEQTNFE